MRHDSTQYVYLTVTAPVDITGETVEVAFEADPDDIPTAWYPATVLSPVEIAILVGPVGEVELQPGLWYPIVRFTATPEEPIISAGSLRIS